MVAVRTHRRLLPECEKFCSNRNMERQNHAEAARRAQVVKIMRDYSFDILGVSECRCTDSRFVNFVDFRKAFDIIYRDALWAVKHFDLPKKIVSLIKLFYKLFECYFMLKKGISDFIEVQASVRQGCMLSPLQAW